MFRWSLVGCHLPDQWMFYLAGHPILLSLYQIAQDLLYDMVSMSSGESEPIAYASIKPAGPAPTTTTSQSLFPTCSRSLLGDILVRALRVDLFEGSASFKICLLLVFDMTSRAHRRCSIPPLWKVAPQWRSSCSSFFWIGGMSPHSFAVGPDQPPQVLSSRRRKRHRR